MLDAAFITFVLNAILGRDLQTLRFKRFWLYSMRIIESLQIAA